MDMNDAFLNTFIQKQTGLINDLQARLLIAETRLACFEVENKQLIDQKVHHEREMELLRGELKRSEEKREELKTRLKQYHKSNEELSTELNAIKIKSTDDIADLQGRLNEADKAAKHYREYAESVQQYVPQPEQNEDLRNQS